MHRRAIALCSTVLIVGCARAPESRPWVASTELRGVHNIGKHELRSGIATRPTPWWQRGPVHVFDELELQSDRERIVRLYETHGYYAAHVVDAEAHPRKGTSAVDVVIAIEEGAPTFVGDVKFFGLADLDPPTKKKMDNEQLGLRRGQVFKHGDYLKFKERMVSVLKQHGYPYVEVDGTVEVSPSSNQAVVTLTFKLGDKKEHS